MEARDTWVLRWATVVMVFAFSIPAQAAPGDMDGDGEVDLKDYELLRPCITGPGASGVGPNCGAGRFDGDLDIDLKDIAGFQLGFTGILNNQCASPKVVSNGTRTYSNRGATTDGPNEPTVCNFFGHTHVQSDIWYCYTASCTGTAVVTLCGSDYDTKLAAYAGCGCPTTAPLKCSDDDCGTGVDIVQSRVEFSVTQGQQYMVRVGGYFGDQGDGQLTIGCNVGNACASGSGDCFAPSPTHAPGCGDFACCADTCALDRFCCDVEWDADCAGEAECLCTGACPACVPGAGSCGVPHTTPGCEEDCCNVVCAVDSFCCLTAWDQTCVDEAGSMCFLICAPGAGSCHSPHATPGCDSPACCEIVCGADSFCCESNWDQTCVDAAAASCP